MFSCQHISFTVTDNHYYCSAKITKISGNLIINEHEASVVHIQPCLIVSRHKKYIEKGFPGNVKCTYIVAYFIILI